MFRKWSLTIGRTGRFNWNHVSLTWEGGQFLKHLPRSELMLNSTLISKMKRTDLLHCRVLQQSQNGWAVAIHTVCVYKLVSLNLRTSIQGKINSKVDEMKRLWKWKWSVEDNKNVSRAGQIKPQQIVIEVPKIAGLETNTHTEKHRCRSKKCSQLLQETNASNNMTKNVPHINTFLHTKIKHKKTSLCMDSVSLKLR